ncbi:uncharacterized protein LOC101529319 [Ochotona princeps]|uniref:uncharacterized protein LOC101529319 n=1 Tax=Ochotona princeps TaxID=9978 RepID=UPI0027152D51|nr:uncharacterized protein LOC101529319 [Ochotona princeps]
MDKVLSKEAQPDLSQPARRWTPHPHISGKCDLCRSPALPGPSIPTSLMLEARRQPPCEGPSGRPIHPSQLLHPVAAASMGPCWALALLLSLAPILRGQSPAPQPTLSQWQGFQAQQFQGDWLVLGLAGNTLTKKDRALLNPFLVTFELNEKGQLEVSNAMTRGKRCDTWNYVLMPESQPGHFRVDGLTGPESEVVQVVEGDYDKFALVVSQRLTGTQTILRISLLAVRVWQLPSEVKNKFFCLAQGQGLTQDNIAFPDLTGNCPRERPGEEGPGPRGAAQHGVTHEWGQLPDRVLPPPALPLGCLGSPQGPRAWPVDCKSPVPPLPVTHGKPRRAVGQQARRAHRCPHAPAHVHTPTLAGCHGDSGPAGEAQASAPRPSAALSPPLSRSCPQTGHLAHTAAEDQVAPPWLSVPLPST